MRRSAAGTRRGIGRERSAQSASEAVKLGVQQAGEHHPLGGRQCIGVRAGHPGCWSVAGEPGDEQSLHRQLRAATSGGIGQRPGGGRECRVHELDRRRGQVAGEVADGLFKVPERGVEGVTALGGGDVVKRELSVALSKMKRGSGHAE